MRSFEDSLVKSIKSSYVEDSYKLIEIVLSDSNVTHFYNTCSKELDAMASDLLVQGVTSVRDLQVSHSQRILIVDITLLTSVPSKLVELFKRIQVYSDKYGIYLIVINNRDSIHIDINAFSSIAITQPTEEVSINLFNNPYLQIMIHPYHYFFKYMGVEVEEGDTQGVVLNLCKWEG